MDANRNQFRFFLYYFLRKVFQLILNKNEVASFNLFEHKFTLDLNLQFLLTFLCIHDLEKKHLKKSIKTCLIHCKTCPEKNVRLVTICLEQKFHYYICRNIKFQPQLIDNEINVPYLQLTTNKLKIHSTNNTDSDISLCQYFIIMVMFMFMVFHAVFNNISVLLVEETRIPGENHRPVVSH